MSLYSEYLDKKSELLSKDLDFQTAVREWFDKHENLELLQPLNVEASLTMDNFSITTTEEFKKHLGDFENEFEVKCHRIFHNEVIIPNEEVKGYWKFHFRESK